MRQHDFLICYDICDKKRLAKLSRYLERISLRVQYSVYLYRADREALTNLAKKLTTLIDKEEDDLRIYRIKEHGVSLGIATDLLQPYILV